MTDISTPTVTPVTDAVLRLIEAHLKRLELAGQLPQNFEVRCYRDGPRVKNCNIHLLMQGSTIIPEDTK